MGKRPEPSAHVSRIPDRPRFHPGPHPAWCSSAFCFCGAIRPARPSAPDRTLDVPAAADRTSHEEAEHRPLGNTDAVRRADLKKNGANRSGVAIHSSSIFPPVAVAEDKKRPSSFEPPPSGSLASLVQASGGHGTLTRPEPDAPSKQRRSGEHHPTDSFVTHPAFSLREVRFEVNFSPRRRQTVVRSSLVCSVFSAVVIAMKKCHRSV